MADTDRGDAMTAGGDLVGLLEEAYDLTGSDRAWVEHLGTAAARVAGQGCFAFVFDVQAPAIVTPSLMVGCQLAEADLKIAKRSLVVTNDGLAANDLAKSLLLGKTTCRTLSSLIERGEGDRRLDVLRTLLSFWTPRDVLGIVGRNPDGSGVGFSYALPSQSRQPKRFLDQWTRVATHLAAALRLRRSLTGLAPAASDGEGVIDASRSRIVHAVGPAKPRSARAALYEAVRAVDRARGRIRRDDPAAAMDLWRGLVAGRWSLIERYESDGRRYYVAHRNEPQTLEPRALNRRESQVVAYAVQGQSNKLIAYTLGLSPSTVGNHLSSAQRKLGVRSRVELVRLATLLQASGRVDAPSTRTELDTVTSSKWRPARSANARRSS